MVISIKKNFLLALCFVPSVLYTMSGKDKNPPSISGKQSEQRSAPMPIPGRGTQTHPLIQPGRCTPPPFGSPPRSTNPYDQLKPIDPSLEKNSPPF